VCLQYEQKLFKLLDDYDKLFMFNADNVGSKQFMDIRAVRLPCTPPCAASSAATLASAARPLHLSRLLLHPWLKRPV
jgi:hypothetical protein